jgi:hypothetical protein
MLNFNLFNDLFLLQLFLLQLVQDISLYSQQAQEIIVLVFGAMNHLNKVKKKKETFDKQNCNGKKYLLNLI